jgi:hypothetical protein
MSKIKTDHVTNSSSSSFIVSKKDLTEEQIEKIRNHVEYSEQFGYASYYTEEKVKEVNREREEMNKMFKDDPKIEPLKSISREKLIRVSDEWNLREKGDIIIGETSMDNFDMCAFLEYIGVDPERVEWRG